MRRMLLVGVPQVLAVVPAVVLMVAGWDRLPERMATRFGFDGSVVDHMSRTGLLLVMIGLGVLLAVVLGLVNRPVSGARGARISRWDMPRLFVVSSWGLAGFLGVVLFGVVEANLDARDAASVSMSPLVLLYALGAAAVTGVVGAVLAPRSEASAPPERDEPPTMDLGPEEHVSWSQPISSPWLAVLGVVLVGAGIVLGWTGGWVAGGPVGAGGLVVLLSSRATVIADRRGLTVRLSVLGWPRMRIGLDDIESAVAEDISPAEFGGWGFRVVPGASGLVLRSGTALVLTRTSGRRFVVTVDDAETAARVLNGLRARRK